MWSTGVFAVNQPVLLIVFQFLLDQVYPKISTEVFIIELSNKEFKEYTLESSFFIDFLFIPLY